MAAGKWKQYDKAGLNALNGELNLSSTTNWKMALFLSTSNCNTLTVHDKFADLTNEVATAFGYTAGGVTLTNVVLSSSGNVVSFDFDPAVWTASGGSITARFAVIYHNTTDGTIVNPLSSVCLLDTAPADVTATTGNTFTVTPNATGAFTITTNNAD